MGFVIVSEALKTLPFRHLKYSQLNPIRCTSGMSCDGFDDFKGQYDFEQYYNKLVSSGKFTITDNEVNLLLSRNSGKVILLIGTAHVSRSSADIVRDAINELRPELVMI